MSWFKMYGFRAPPNAVLESTVSSTELSEFVGLCQVLARELSELASDPAKNLKEQKRWFSAVVVYTLFFHADLKREKAEKFDQLN